MSEIARWQSDAQRCFNWISKMYEQAQTVWNDAWAMLEEEQWDVQSGSGFGGIAMSMGDLANWPFAYFRAMGATPCGSEDQKHFKGVFFGFVFYDTKRDGPFCVAGVANWTDENTNCDHWTLYSAVNGDVDAAFENMFENDDMPVHLARVTDKGKRVRRGMGDVRWFEVPLGSLTSAERLREIVQAAIALYSDDEQPARAVVAQSAERLGESTAEQGGAPDGAPNLAALGTAPRG